MSLRSKLKRLKNRAFPHARIRLARQEHMRLSALDTTLPEELLRDARIVPNRNALLQRMPRNGVVAEIGVAQGDFSKQITEISQPNKLYLIDAWAMALPQFGEPALQSVQAHFSEAISTGQVEILRGWSWDMVATLPDNSLDWAYVDASHDFEPVVKDLTALKSKIKPGGYICGHDYIEWSRNMQRYGVIEAVHRFALENKWPMAFLSLDSDTNGSFALQKPT